MIVTTFSEQKAEHLRMIGAYHAINYKTDPNWDDTTKFLLSNREG